jgi:hypothetical protein
MKSASDFVRLTASLWSLSLHWEAFKLMFHCFNSAKDSPELRDFCLRDVQLAPRLCSTIGSATSD